MAMEIWVTQLSRAAKDKNKNCGMAEKSVSKKMRVVAFEASCHSIETLRCLWMEAWNSCFRSHRWTSKWVEVTVLATLSQTHEFCPGQFGPKSTSRIEWYWCRVVMLLNVVRPQPGAVQADSGIFMVDTGISPKWKFPFWPSNTHIWCLWILGVVRWKLLKSCYECQWLFVFGCIPSPQ